MILTTLPKSCHIYGIKVVNSGNGTNETNKGKLLLLCGYMCDIFDISMDIYHGKFTLRNASHTHKMQFPIVKGKFTMVKVSHVTAPTCITTMLPPEFWSLSINPADFYLCFPHLTVMVTQLQMVLYH